MTPTSDPLLILAVAVTVLAFVALGLLALASWLDTRDALARDRRNRERHAAYVQQQVDAVPTRHYRMRGGR
ncbi:hypothetical protein DEIPH_ctg052orf0048 [Deinococcus phoenicis]|uniref:Uncharacterized protein n=1 Tax=Deinococcus phoenicis TaxID=1476583 RepID=A0A016QLR8_9DEIO|nr:hypothetical protein [Deinococcus phoenicis]EYB67050.1 hypothetical protein DEIPH_ctg052orf0048 [Deinococcus phoenicis]